MSEQIKRYGLVGDYDLRIDEVQDGDYVLRSDHERLLQAERAKVAELERERDEAEKFIDRIFDDLDQRAKMAGEDSIGIGSGLVFAYSLMLKDRRKRECKAAELLQLEKNHAK